MLKNKVRQAQLSLAKRKEGKSYKTFLKITKKSTRNLASFPEKSASIPAATQSSGSKLKNVIKNYGRAICNFILSEASSSYLEKVLKELSINRIEFLAYIREQRSYLKGISEFRHMLLPSPTDDERILLFKKAFQQLSEIFVKYFSVNWIFSGKLLYRIEYVKYRNKLLRRIKNPHLFFK